MPGRKPPLRRLEPMKEETVGLLASKRTAYSAPGALCCADSWPESGFRLIAKHCRRLVLFRRVTKQEDDQAVTTAGRDKRCYGKRRNGTLPALAYNSARSMILLANSVSAVCSRGGGFQTAAITPSDVHRKDGFECRRTWSASSPTVSFHGVTPSCRCRRCATPPLGSSALRSE